LFFKEGKPVKALRQITKNRPPLELFVTSFTRTLVFYIVV
jgi:hypothetical protein